MNTTKQPIIAAFEVWHLSNGNVHTSKLYIGEEARNFINDVYLCAELHTFTSLYEAITSHDFYLSLAN